MTHHEAQAIADAYAERASYMLNTTTMSPSNMERWNSMRDHAAVWKRITDTLKQEAPNVP